MNDDDYGNVVSFPKMVDADNGITVTIDDMVIPHFAEWAGIEFFKEIKMSEIDDLTQELQDALRVNPDLTEYVTTSLKRLVKHIKKNS